jgi:hypothetical protein
MLVALPLPPARAYLPTYEVTDIRHCSIHAQFRHVGGGVGGGVVVVVAGGGAVLSP